MNALELLQEEVELQNCARLNAESQLEARNRELVELQQCLKTLTESSQPLSASPSHQLSIEDVRLRAEERLRLQGQVLEQVAMGRPLAGILDQLCQLVEAALDNSCCSILQFDLDHQHLGLLSGPTLSPRYREVLTTTTRLVAANSFGIAAFQQQPVYVVNIQHDNAWGSLREVGAELEIQAFWSYPIRVNQEVVGCFCISLRNVAAPTSDQKALLEMAANLTGIASKRHRDEQMLAQTLVKAESANRAKSEFLANMSHEIRTPLTAITGYADLLSTPENRSLEDVKWARQILRSARHLGMLLDDILDLSKVEAGRLTVERRPVDFLSIIEDVAEMFRPQVEDKLLGFAVHTEPLLPRRIMCDSTRMRQVLTNLVSNAVKFTEKGEIQIQVGRVSVSSEKKELHIGVVDTGVGMTAEQITHLFQPFERLHQETLATPGTGLGLAISKRLVELMGGRIEIESQAGRGTRFSLVLPIEPGSDSAIDIDWPARPVGASHSGLSISSMTATGNPEELRGLKVLLVEDNSDNVSIFTHLLEPLGVLFTLASNGQEAVHEVLGTAERPVNTFDVILMDMQMPVMDGFEATAKLRQAGVNTPIIALSAFAMASDKERCLKAGCSLIVTKPVLRQELVAALLDTCWLRVVSIDQAPVPPPAIPATPKPEPVSETPTKKPSFTALLESYRGSLEKYLGILERAEANNDCEEICKATHRLNGTASNYGYPEITKSASACERILRQGGHLAEIQSDLTHLKSLIHAAIKN
jgi:signal transduction histidine kinase/CheY-like chemotaxis protein/HPt (histidine-containing phosphotransfer) domain-containing protein